MKFVTILICWILAAFCIYFPFSYFHNYADKKEIKISHILVKTEEEAKSIKEKLKEQTFEDLAKKYSLCESKEQEGNIGYTTKGLLLPEIQDKAFKLKVNEVSEPIQSSEGWHILKIYDIKYFSDKENFSKRYF